MTKESNTEQRNKNWSGCQKFLHETGKPTLELLESRPCDAEGKLLETGRAPILFIHGAWSSAATWEPLFLPWFARQGYRCCALSLRGHGGSGCDKWLRLCRVQDYLEDIERAVEHLGEPPVLVGLSMGGYLVQKYLETHRAPGAVLMAPVPVKGTGNTTRIMWRDRPWSFLMSALFFDSRLLMRTHDQVRRSCFSSRQPYEFTRHFYESRTDESVLINLDMSRAALPQPEKVRDPVLVLGAENDFFFPPEQIRETARAYGAEAVIFPKAAHVLPLELVWEDVAKVIDDWFHQVAAKRI